MATHKDRDDGGAAEGSRSGPSARDTRRAEVEAASFAVLTERG